MLLAFARKLLIWFGIIAMAMVASAVYFVIHDNRLTLAISVMDIFSIRFEIGKMSVYM